jgi:hypothetical protein
LETRTLLAIHVLSTIEGINRITSSCNCEPADTDIAVGPAQVVETVNTAIAFFDKDTGDQLFRQSLTQFFARVGTGQDTSLSDPLVVYDDLAQRFFVLVLEYNVPMRHTFVSFAVSDTSNPLDGFTAMHRYETTVTLPDGTKLGSDYPKLGFNAEAYAITVDMDLFTGGFVDPVQGKLLTIDKSSVLNHDPNSLTIYDVNLDVGSDTPIYAMAPATMHGAVPDGPLYAVRETTRFGGDSLTVIALTNLLSNNPTLTEYVIPVPPYTRPPQAVHPPNKHITTFESFILNADWRDNRLAATMDIGLEGDTVVRAAWFDFATGGDAPVLAQSGVIDQGPGVHTYFSAIAVAATGDLGLTFMESSATEPISMYITGQPARAYGSGRMLPPVAVAVGAGNYSGKRGGDFAGMAVDPEAGNVFWAGNMYTAAAGTLEWGTRIASFRLRAHATPADLELPSAAVLVAVLPDHGPAMRATPVAPPVAPAVVPSPEAARVDLVFAAAVEAKASPVRSRVPSPQGLAANPWSGVFDRDNRLLDLV